MKILVINPGSTSTKVALFEDLLSIKEKKIAHSNEELAQFDSISDELPMRVMRVTQFLKEEGIELDSIDVVAARGGMLPPVRYGAYKVDERMVETLLEHPAEHHASNLGAGIAFYLLKGTTIPAYIYDAVSVDELRPVARLTGVKGYDKRSFTHALNARAVSREVAKREGFELETSNVIVAHLGGGVTLSMISKGSLIDVVGADDGPFSPERAGGLPIFSAAQIVRAEGLDALYKYTTGRGGLLSYTGSNDAIAVEKRALAGDAYARLLYEAIAYQTAKSIGSLSTVVKGEVRAIILTGGMAHSKLITDDVESRVRFIAPVHLFPGEMEMVALAAGAWRVMRGEEEARVFQP